MTNKGSGYKFGANSNRPPQEFKSSQFTVAEGYQTKGFRGILREDKRNRRHRYLARYAETTWLKHDATTDRFTKAKSRGGLFGRKPSFVQVVDWILDRADIYIALAVMIFYILFLIGIFFGE